VRLLADSGPTPRELDRAKNSAESDFLNAMERMGSFGGKADRLNYYSYYVGTADYFQQDLERYRRVTAADVQRAARTYLRDAHRVVLSVVPQGKPEQAVRPGAIP
jgi:zinc protease